MFDKLREAGNDPEIPMVIRFVLQSLYGFLLSVFILPLIFYRLVRLFIICLVFLGRGIFLGLGKLWHSIQIKVNDRNQVKNLTKK